MRRISEAIARGRARYIAYIDQIEACSNIHNEMISKSITSFILSINMFLYSADTMFHTHPKVPIVVKCLLL